MESVSRHREAVSQDVFFFKKEIDRLGNEIRQYQEENLALKMELKNLSFQQSHNSLDTIKDQLKDLLTQNNQPLDTDEITKLQSTLKDKDQQLEVLSRNLETLKDTHQKIQEGFKEERRLLANEIQKLKESLTQETTKLSSLVSDYSALESKHTDFISQTLSSAKGRKGKKDLAYQETIDGQQKIIDALKTKLKSVLEEAKGLKDTSYLATAENRLLREKLLQAAKFSRDVSTSENLDAVAVLNKISNFCQSVAESKVTKGS